MSLKKLVEYYFCKDVEDLYNYRQSNYREFFTSCDNEYLSRLLNQMKFETCVNYLTRGILPSAIEAFGVFAAINTSPIIFPFFIAGGELLRYFGYKAIQKEKADEEYRFRMLSDLEKRNEKDWKDRYTEMISKLLDQDYTL